MNQYGPKANRVIEQTMKKYASGKLHSGKAGEKVTDHDQAVAISISLAREKGYKTPRQKTGD